VLKNGSICSPVIEDEELLYVDQVCCSARNDCEDCSLNSTCSWCGECYDTRLGIPCDNRTDDCKDNCSTFGCSECYSSSICIWNNSSNGECYQSPSCIVGNTNTPPSSSSEQFECDIINIKTINDCNNISIQCQYTCLALAFTQASITFNNQQVYFNNNLNLTSQSLYLNGKSSLNTLGNLSFYGESTLIFNGDSFINTSQCVDFNSKTNIQVNDVNVKDNEEIILFKYQCLQGKDNIQIDESCSNGYQKSLVATDNEIGVVFSSCWPWWAYLILILSIVVVVTVIVFVVFRVKSIRESIFPYNNGRKKIISTKPSQN